MGREVDESQLDEPGLLASDEVFLTNALMGVMPVCAIDGQTIGTGTPGPITQSLRTAYDDWLSSAHLES
jgi:branched-subunit amino acid aminotransferase/4-amino-4-deoxychorismate lyase